MSREIARRTSTLQPSDAIEGELVDMVEHGFCGDQHPAIDGWMECCCGDTHTVDDFVCCQCGHHHDMNGRCLPAGPCGSFICCIN